MTTRAAAQPRVQAGRRKSAAPPSFTLGVMKYNLRKVLSTDWPALAAAWGIPIIWAIHFGFPYLHPTALPLPIWFPAAISAGLITWLVWRIGRVARLFAHGQLTSGQVAHLSIAKDRGRLEFAFEYQGKRICTWTPIHKTKTVLALAPGAIVEVLFDTNHPTRAIVKHLYAA